MLAKTVSCDVFLVINQLFWFGAILHETAAFSSIHGDPHKWLVELGATMTPM